MELLNKMHELNDGLKGLIKDLLAMGYASNKDLLSIQESVALEILADNCDTLNSMVNYDYNPEEE